MENSDIVSQQFNAAYQIDDQDPVPFLLSSTTNLDDPLFAVPDMSVGEHVVVVALNGSSTELPVDSEQAVFNFGWFYMTSLTTAEQASLVSLQSGARHSNNIVIYVGATLGPLALFLIGFAILWARRKSKQERALAVQRSAMPIAFLSQFGSFIPHNLVTNLGGVSEKRRRRRLGEFNY